MFLGPGIVGNRVIGATDEKQQLHQVNPETLAIDKPSGIRIRPEHIHHALRELANIQDHPSSQRFPLGVAANEKLRNFWA